MYKLYTVKESFEHIKTTRTYYAKPRQGTELFYLIDDTGRKTTIHGSWLTPVCLQIFPVIWNRLKNCI